MSHIYVHIIFLWSSGLTCPQNEIYKCPLFLRLLQSIFLPESYKQTGKPSGCILYTEKLTSCLFTVGRVQMFAGDQKCYRNRFVGVGKCLRILETLNWKTLSCSNSLISQLRKRRCRKLKLISPEPEIPTVLQTLESQGLVWVTNLPRP